MDKTQDLCDWLLQRVEKEKLLAAQEKQRLKEVKERCNQLDQAKKQCVSHLRSLILPREECVEVEHAKEEHLEVRKQEEYVVVCEQEKRYDS